MTSTKLEEVKAKAGDAIAQEIQSHFLTMAHNPLTLFRGHLQDDYEIKKEKFQKEYNQRNKHQKKQTQANKTKVHRLNEKMPLVVQMSMQYVKVLRNIFFPKNAYP
jgi:ATP-dependent protease ClpP protease subunit